MPSYKVNCPSILGCRMDGPVVNKQLAIDPQHHTIVCIAVKGIGLGKCCLHLAGPSNREVVFIDHARLR